MLYTLGPIHESHPYAIILAEHHKEAAGTKKPVNNQKTHVDKYADQKKKKSPAKKKKKK
jgi:hypothetical protein